MIAHRMLSLSNSQLEMVLDCAKLVRPEYRERYLHDIADQLLPLDERTDDAIRCAVERTLHKMGVEAA
jgi:hypothetical protein